MVTIANATERTRKSDGSIFVSLDLIGEPTVTISSNGVPSLTAPRASLPSNLSLAVCQSLIGQKLPGSIERVECEPYQYIKENGDVMTCTHKFQYSPEETSAVMTANPPMQLQSVNPFMGMAA